MKICVISYHCCPFSLLGGDGTGGMNTYLRELSFSLTRLPGVKVDIFTRIQTPDIRGIKNVSPRVRVIHLKGGPENSVDRRIPYDYIPEFSDNLEDFIIQERYDVVYSHYWLSGLVGRLIKKKYDVPHIHMYHTLAFLKKRMSEEGQEHEKRLESEEYLAYVSDALVSSSEQESRNLTEFYSISPSKIKVINPGVNKELFHLLSEKTLKRENRSENREKILLYVGRIEPVKGLMTIMEFLSLLKKKNPFLFNKVKLFVIGGGKKDSDLYQNKEFVRIKRFLKENKLTQKVIFLGSKKQANLKYYYSAADVLIVPSLYESFGLVVVEALACGTPVIVSQIGEMRTIVKEGQNGFSFRPNEPLSLYRSLEQFFSNEKKIWNKEKISQEVTNRFSWERTAEETYLFFTGILKEKAFSTTISLHDGNLRPA